MTCDSFISKSYNWLKHFTRENLPLFCHLFFGSAALAALLRALGVSGAAVGALPFIAGDILLVCLLATLLGRRFRTVVHIVGGGLIVIETYLAVCWRLALGPQAIILLVNTDGSETAEFLRGAVSRPATYASLALGAAIVAGAAWLAPKVLRWLGAISGQNLPKIVSPRRKTIARAAIALVLCAASLSSLGLWRGMVSLATSDNLTKDLPPLGPLYHAPSPWMRLYGGIANQQIQRRMMGDLVQVVKRTKVQGCAFDSPSIVLILGESHSKRHSSIYDTAYAPTMPRMRAREAAGGLVAFTDAVSPSNSTYDVIRAMFSMHSHGAARPWPSYTLLPAIFRAAGYRVTFLSNQYVESDAGSSFDLQTGFIFAGGGLGRLQFDRRNKARHRHDGQLLADIDAADIDTGHPRLTLLHLQGSHMRYADRHPAAFAPIPREMATPCVDGDKQRDECWHYDNSVAYTDLVLDSLMAMYAGTETVFVYVADHGEECYDWRDQHGRTFEAQISAQVARYQYEVPFFVAATEGWRQTHAEMWRRVEEAKDRPFMTDDLPHLLLGLAGIGHADYDPRRDLLSPLFDTSRRRLLRGTTDYDSLMRAAGR